MLNKKQRVSLAYSMAVFVINEGCVEIDSGTDYLVDAIRDIIEKDSEIDDIVEEILLDKDPGNLYDNLETYRAIFKKGH